MSEQISRTKLIAQAIARQLDQRRTLIDIADDLGQITITVKMHAGQNHVRGIVWEEERVCRATDAARRPGP